MMNRPPRRQYSCCCRIISSAKFHAKIITYSGWRSSSVETGRMGIYVPGVNQPIFIGLLSTVYGMRCEPMPQ